MLSGNPVNRLDIRKEATRSVEPSEKFSDDGKRKQEYFWTYIQS